MGDDVKLKHHQLVALVQCILSHYHGNAVPERGFSLNRNLLDVHGFSTSEQTIISLRLVKDYIHHVPTKFPTSGSLINCCGNAKAKCIDTAEKKKAEENAVRKRIQAGKERVERINTQILALADLEKHISDQNPKIRVADNLILEAGAELKKITSGSEKGTLKREDLLAIQE